jgi:hypothetical protein
MTETREQINPKVAPATKALLLTYCQEKHTTKSEEVEAALRTFLHPKEGDDLAMVMLQLLHGIAAKQEALDQGVAAMVPLLATIVERLEGQQTEAAVPMARYDQMYAELRPEPAPAVVEVPPAVQEAPAQARGVFGRLFPARAAS